MPEKIAVKWFRDGDFIIGDIEADGYSFKTQAKSAREFVEMVNDALFSVYKIPVKYFPYLENRKFQPTKEQFQKLNDEAVKKSSFNFKKFNEAYQS